MIQLQSVKPSAELRREVIALGNAACLNVRNHFSVYLTRAERVPRIAALLDRTASFPTPLHAPEPAPDAAWLLFAWDHSADRPAAGYRLRLGREVLERCGCAGFAVNRCFAVENFAADLLERSVELGAYQTAHGYERAAEPATLLCQSLVYLLKRHTEFELLFTTAKLCDHSSTPLRSTLVRFLRRSFHAPQYAGYFPARFPYGEDESLDIDHLAPNDFEGLEQLLTSATDRLVRLPHLLRQYLRFGARFAGFNLDRLGDYTLDGLLVLDRAQFATANAR